MKYVLGETMTKDIPFDYVLSDYDKTQANLRKRVAELEGRIAELNQEVQTWKIAANSNAVERDHFQSEAWKLGEQLGASLVKVSSAEEKLAEAQTILTKILEDMKRIPNGRLPLGKVAWLQEWSEVEEKLQQLGETLSPKKSAGEHGN